MSPPPWPPLPRPLPFSVAPVGNETYESYLGRLAVANKMTFSDVDEFGGIDDDDPLCLARLASISGRSARSLLYALPELSHNPRLDTSAMTNHTWPIPKLYINIIQPACTRCAAAAGADPDATNVWATHDMNVCLRHRTWIGPGNQAPYPQPNLAGQPEIVQAQRRHHRLIRRQGRATIRAAFNVASGLWNNLSTADGYNHERDARIAREHQQTIHWGGDPDEPIAQAAIYPEAVALTAVLASTRCRALATSRNPADNRLFHDELRRRVTPHHDGAGPPRMLFWLRRDLDRTQFDQAETASTGHQLCKRTTFTGTPNDNRQNRPDS
jgi:TniQ